MSGGGGCPLSGLHYQCWVLVVLLAGTVMLTVHCCECCKRMILTIFWSYFLICLTLWMNSVQPFNSIKLWWLWLMYCNPPHQQKASSEREPVDSEQLWHTDTRLLISMCRQHQRSVSKVILTELYLTWAKSYSLSEAPCLTHCVMKVRWKVFVSMKRHHCPPEDWRHTRSHTLCKMYYVRFPTDTQTTPTDFCVQWWKQTHHLVNERGKINRALSTKNSIFAAH